MTDKPAESAVEALVYFDNYDAKYGRLVADPHQDGATQEWMRSARAATHALQQELAEAKAALELAEAENRRLEWMLAMAVAMYVRYGAENATVDSFMADLEQRWTARLAEKEVIPSRWQPRAELDREDP